MTNESKNRQEIEDYLLNKSSEESSQEIEKKLITDDEFYDFFQTVECDLYEKYLEGNYSRNDKNSFEKYFLAHPQRREDLWLTQALKEKAKNNKSAKKSIAEKESKPWSSDFRKIVPIFAPVFVILLLVIGGIFWWNSRNPDLDKGLIALKDYYKIERPVQSRVSDFEYSSFIPTRGNSEKESTDLRIAETFLLQAVKNNPNTASYNALGKFYLASKKFDNAIENFSNALDLDENNPKLNNDLGSAWLEKGKSILSKDKGKAAIDFGESLKYFDKAISVDKKSPEALFNRSETYQNLYLPKKAIEDLQNYLQQDSTSRWADEVRERLKILEEQQNKVSLTEDGIIENFKIAYQAKDKNQAWEMIKLSRSRAGNLIVQNLITDFLSRPPNDEDNKNNLAMLKFAADVEKQTVGDSFSSDLVDFYSNLTTANQISLIKARELMKEAQAEYKTSAYQPAADKYAEAKKFFTDSGDFPEALQADAWIGFCNLRIPNVQESLKIFNNLAQIYDQKKYKSLYAQSLIGIADAQSDGIEPSKAIENTEKALKSATEIQDIETQIRGYQMLIVTKSDLGQYAESLEKGLEAIDLSQKFPTKPNVSWTLYKVSAENFHALNLLNSAIAYQEKAAQLDIQPIQKLLSFTQLAKFQSENGNFTEALKSAELALLPDEPKKDKKFQENITAQVSLTLGDIYRNHNDFQKALENYQTSQNIYENTIDIEPELYKIYNGKMLCHIGLNENDLAQEELNKSLEKLEVWRKNIKSEDDRNQFFDIKQNSYDSAISFANLQLKNSELALNYAEKSRARTLLNLAEPESNPSEIRDIQNQISNDVQILEFAVLEDRIISWVITKNELKSFETPIKSSELKKNVREYVNFLIKGDDSAKNDLDKSARELYSLLISPSESLLDQNKSLFIVPDKDLNFLPFASLIKPETNKYLIENFKIGISPSLNLFVINSVKAKEKSVFTAENILSVGNPKFDSEKFKNLENLPSAEREAEKIAAFYDSSTLLLREQATKEKVVANLSKFEIVHLALHAITDAQNPTQSGFVLSQTIDSNNVLHAEEIYARKDFLKTKLVILSACETGIEQTLRGEGAISLARPFIANNVPMVIASLWKVNSEATAELMINFHQNRKQKHLDSLEAMRQAQLDMIHSQNTSFRQPQAWSSFIAIGGEANY